MKLIPLFCATVVCPLALVAGGATGAPAFNDLFDEHPTAPPPSDIPHLRRQGTATQLIVDGKPFLALAGELGNNTATSLEYMDHVWPKLIETHLNCALAAVSWAQIEPEEGKFDFSVLDGVIQGARSHNLRLVLLWFGSWKNGMSSYPPDWLKADYERFPRAQGADGRSIEQLSTFSAANRDADANAFGALMGHVKKVDGQQHTVIMIQVENEINGLDHSPLATKAHEGQAPKELMDYLESHKETLTPELRQVWEAAGSKTSGTWEEVFGKGGGADEICIAWHYASYTGRVAEAGKAEYPIPMYVNSWGEGFPKGGQRANGAPKPSVIDIWRAGAPKIDMLSPDIYDSDFAGMCAEYTQYGNPLFIPETRGFPPNNLATRVLYAFGRHDAMGFSPMGIERPPIPDIELTSAYDVIRQLSPLISAHQGNGTMSAVLLAASDAPKKVRVGNYSLECSFMKPSALPGQLQPQPPFPNSAAIFISAGPDEFYAAGNGVKVLFTPTTPGPPQAGLATVEEGVFVDGRWVPGRRLAGDDTSTPALVLPRLRIVADQPALAGPSFKGILRFTLYRYK